MLGGCACAGVDCAGVVAADPFAGTFVIGCVYMEPAGEVVAAGCCCIAFAGCGCTVFAGCVCVVVCAAFGAVAAGAGFCAATGACCLYTAAPLAVFL
jgi:hypothetical protein